MLFKLIFEVGFHGLSDRSLQWSSFACCAAHIDILYIIHMDLIYEKSIFNRVLIVFIVFNERILCDLEQKQPFLKISLIGYHEEFIVRVYALFDITNLELIVYLKNVFGLI